MRWSRIPSLEATERVRVGNNLAALLNSRNHRDTSIGSKLLVSAQAKVLIIKVLIDHTGHALLAMRASLLSTVVPDGLLILHHNLEHILILPTLSLKVEASEEGVPVIERLAGLAEAGLRNGVVLGEEVPLDNIADFSDDVVRVEAETAEAGNDGVGDAGEVGGSGDFLGGCGGGCGGDGDGGGQGEDGEECGVHLDGSLKMCELF